MPVLWWALAAVWLVRDVYGNLLTADRPDARALMVAGGHWLHDPSAIYSEAERALSSTGYVPGFGFIKPPAAAMPGGPGGPVGPGRAEWRTVASSRSPSPRGARIGAR